MAVGAAGLAVFAALYVPQPMLPLLAAELGVSPGQAAWSVSVATFGLAAGLLPAAWLSDAVGRTRLMTASLWLAAGLGAAAALAPTWTALLAVRGLQGVALAGLPAAAMAYLREEVHPWGHARAVGLYVAGTAVGGMSGRLVAGALADLAGWRAAFLGVGALCLVSAAVCTWLLPAARGFAPSSWRPRAALAALASTLRDPALLALFGIATTLMGAFVAYYNALGFRLEAAPYRLSVAAVGLVYLAYAAGSVGSATVGAAADRWGRRPLMPIAVAVTAAGAALSAASPLWVVVAGTVVLTFGFFAAHGLASGWVAARAHATGRATAGAAAVYSVAYYVGATVPGALGPVAYAGGGWSRVLVVVGGLLLAAAGLSVVLRRTRPAR